MEKLMINLSEDTLTVNREATTKEILDILISCYADVAKSSIDKAPEEIKEDYKGMLYDTCNATFTAALEYIAPDKELRPDLHMEAILKAEEDIIKSKQEVSANED